MRLKSTFVVTIFPGNMVVPLLVKEIFLLFGLQLLCTRLSLSNNRGKQNACTSLCFYLQKKRVGLIKENSFIEE